MAKAPKTEFGRRMRKRLDEINKPYEWLCEQIHKDTGGKFMDTSYLCKFMNGKKKSKVIIDSICRILDIEYSDKV